MRVPRHTPAPWKRCHHLESAEKDKSCPCGWVGDIYGGDGEAVVCTIGPHCPTVVEGADMLPRYPREQELANAALIAAAPEMLDALKELMTFPIPHEVGCSHKPDSCSCHKAKALAAIAKAEGRDNG